MAKNPKKPLLKKPSATPTTGDVEFDPMVVHRPLPKFEAKQLGAVRLMLLGGATTADVAAFLDVDILTVEELLEKHLELKPHVPEEQDERGGSGAKGRPTAYEAKFVKQAKLLASLGATDLEVSQFFGCSVRTLHRWKIEHPRFREALAIGKDEADDKVEQSLYKRAVGYTFDSEKIVVVDKMVERVETIEHVPPDTKAALAWLYNRRPGLWRTTVHQKHDVEPESKLAQFLDSLSGSMLQPIDEESGAAPTSTLPIADEG